jgi:hypothetical protein
LVAALLGAGCAGPASTPAAQATVAAVTSADVHQGGARIEGRVVDAEFVPVPDALVQVYPGDDQHRSVANVSSDARGAFVVQGLDKGRYVLYAARTGYRSAAPKRVEASDIGATNVTITLEALRAPRPFHVTSSYQFHYTLSVCYAGSQGTCLDLLPGGNTTIVYRIDEKADGPLQTLVIEMRWTPTSVACDDPMRSDVYSPDQVPSSYYDAATRGPKNPHHWDNLPGTTSPTRVWIPRAGSDGRAVDSAARLAANAGKPLRTSGVWQIIADGAPHRYLDTEALSFSCATDQRIDLWATSFYVNPASDEHWTATAAV